MSEGPRRVQLGDVVGFRYLIKDENDVVLAASTELVHCVQGGDHSLPRGVEDDMKGRVCGETFTTAVPVREAMMRRLLLPEDRFPKAFALTPGTRIDLRAPDGEGFAVWVDGSDSKTLALGLDHPIGGKSIRFQVSIISIRVAIGESQDHGDVSRLDWELEAELLDLRARLDAKFSEEGAPGGLFEALVAEDCTTAQRVGVLREQHTTLLSHLDSIITQVREKGDAYDYIPALVGLVRSLARHDEASTDMFIESVNRDNGGEG